mgnify:FL=1
MTDIKDKSIELFLAELAGKSATPGGGSAAALMGAQAAALTSMMCNLTIGKAGYEAVESDMRQLLTKSEALRVELMNMIRADVNAFDALMAAYGLPKNTDAEKSTRSECIQEALKTATLVPLKCAKSCADAIILCKEAAEKGNLNVISDAGVGVMSAYAGLKSAALNVYINTNSLKDKTFSEKALADLDIILAGSEIMTEEIYQAVKNKL